MRFFVMITVLIWSFSVSARESLFFKKGFPGPSKVNVQNIVIFDDVKKRDLKAVLYIPQHNQKLASIVFSHDYYENADAYSWLLEHWASYGYLCICINHSGTDEHFFNTADYAQQQYTLRSFEAFSERVEDIRIVLDELSHMNTQGQLAGRIDLYKTAVCGKNIGAWAALSTAGQVYYRNNKRYSFFDERVSAVLCLNSLPVEKGKVKGIYNKISVPCMYICDMEHEKHHGITSVHRRIPFDRISGCEQVFVQFKEGTIRMNPASEYQEFENHRIIRIISTAFLDSYLYGSRSARDFLLAGGAERISGIDTIYETKLW